MNAPSVDGGQYIESTYSTQVKQDWRGPTKKSRARLKSVLPRESQPVPSVRGISLASTHRGGPWCVDESSAQVTG